MDERFEVYQIEIDYRSKALDNMWQQVNIEFDLTVLYTLLRLTFFRSM